MGYAARKNAALRANGTPPARHLYTTSGPVTRPLRLTDEAGREIYRELPWGQVVRVAPKRA